MRTVAKVYRDAEPEWNRWRDSLGEFGDLLERELLDELVRCRGFPADAVHAKGVRPPEHGWRFGGATVRYQLFNRFAPKRPLPSGAVIARCWRWLRWRAVRRRELLVLIVGMRIEPSPDEPPTPRR